MSSKKSLKKPLQQTIAVLTIYTLSRAAVRMKSWLGNKVSAAVACASTRTNRSIAQTRCASINKSVSYRSDIACRAPATAGSTSRLSSVRMRPSVHIRKVLPYRTAAWVAWPPTITASLPAYRPSKCPCVIQQFPQQQNTAHFQSAILQSA